jgi:hypothetical protein
MFSETRYALNGDLRVAYRASREGPPSVDGTYIDWVSDYTIPARGGGKVVEVLTAPLIRSLAFRAILTGCAKALES